MNPPYKIEFGSNGRKMDGWICTDIDTADIRKPLNWSDNSCEQLHISHCLEHVSSASAIGFLQECFRILQPGGVLRVIVPAVGTHMERAHVVNLLDNSHGHCQGYNEELLRVMLWAAGFELNRIQRTDRNPMDNHHLQIGDERDSLESLRLEARK